jgi:hypothetical protein
MARFKVDSTGQALIETLLSIPLLFLLAASAIQFTILFQARCAFDKACGEAARQYAANLLKDTPSITAAIWNDLGPYQLYFNQQSLNITTQISQTTIEDTVSNSLGNLGFPSIVSKFKSYVINYGGQSWSVTISCTPPSLVAVIFPNGIQFQSQLSLIKYPS